MPDKFDAPQSPPSSIHCTVDLADEGRQCSQDRSDARDWRNGTNGQLLPFWPTAFGLTSIARLIPEAPAVERVVVLRPQFASESDLELDGQCRTVMSAIDVEAFLNGAAGGLNAIQLTSRRVTGADVSSLVALGIA